MNEDFYEPSGTIGLGRLEKYWALRKQSSRPAEQAAILLAMAQAQARMLDLSRFDPKMHRHSSLQTLQVRDGASLSYRSLTNANNSPLSLWLTDTTFRS